MNMDWIRRHQKAMLWFIVFFIGIPFAFFGIGGLRPRRGANMEIGRLFGQPVYQDILRDFSLRWSVVFPIRWRPSSAQFWDLYTQYKTAEHYGIQVTEDEINDYIVRRFKDAEGNYSAEDFRKYLENHNRILSNNSYRKTLKEHLMVMKLIQAFSLYRGDTRRERLDAAKMNNHEIRIAYLQLDEHHLPETLEPTDEDLRNHYEEHRGQYRRGERVRGEYILFDEASVKESLPEPTEEDLKQQIEAERAFYAARAKIKNAEARKASETDAAAQADTVRDRDKTDRDEVTDDAILKALREELVKDFQDSRIQSLIDGKIQQVLTSIRNKEDEIFNKIREQEKALIRLGKDTGPEAEAIQASIQTCKRELGKISFQDLAKSLDGIWAETDLFTKEEARSRAVIGCVDLQRAIEQLPEGGYSGAIRLAPKKSKYIFKVTEKTGPSDMSFEEAREAVKKDWKEEKTAGALKDLARKLKEAVTTGKTFKTVADEASLEIKQSPWVKYADPFPISDYPPYSNEKKSLFTTPNGGVAEPLLSRDGKSIYLVQVLAHRNAPDDLPDERQWMLSLKNNILANGLQGEIDRIARRTQVNTGSAP